MKRLINKMLQKWRTTRNPWLLGLKEVVWFPVIVAKAAPGKALKIAVNLRLLRPKPLNSTPRERRVIVSLTSYGRRVGACAHVAITSMMRQSFPPDKIILWLAKAEFESPEALPRPIKRLMDDGLEVRFIEDMRSYKKLLPALKEYPDDWVVTIDDDCYYPREVMKTSYEKMLETGGRSILTGQPYKVAFSANGTLLPYRQWPQHAPDGNFCLGASMIWFRADLLHPDATRYDIAVRLAPIADDVWDFFMATLGGTRIIASGVKRPYIDIDLWHQHYHRGASLCDYNFYRNENDPQIRAVMNYYGLTDEWLRNFLYGE